MSMTLCAVTALPSSFEISFAEEIATSKKIRNEKMVEAVERYGYSQKAVADHLGLHYSTVSRLITCETAKMKT